MIDAMDAPTSSKTLAVCHDDAFSLFCCRAAEFSTLEIHSKLNYATNEERRNRLSKAICQSAILSLSAYAQQH